jgi:IPT/TIG domain-containing protein
MIKHRNHNENRMGRRLAACAVGAARPLVAAGAAGMLAAAMLTAAALAGAAPAGAAPAPHKSAALARAEATGFAGLHGGHGSGKEVGRSRVTRTARPPVLTPAQLRIQRQAALMPVLGPAKAQGTPVARRARPAVPPVDAARPAGHAARTPPAAPTDFEYYRTQNVSPGDSQSGTNEPSVANDGNDVLYTGNWYAAQSTDSGNTFSYINPYTLGPTPTLPNGGFCCDQVAIHAPANGITAWGLLYCPVNNNCGSGDNIIRLAVARNQADLASDTFDYYDFSAQTFGFPAGDWLDYPHFGVNADYLSLSMNVFNGGTFVDSILVKFDLSSFLTGNWSANWVYDNQDFTWTPTDNSTDSWTYWAATAYENGSLIRVYNWPPNTDYTHVSWNDFTVNFNYEWKDGSCPAPDGNNWCAFDDSRVKTGGEVGTSTVYFMWDAKQGGGFNYPYVDYASFDVSTGPATSVSESQIWNGSYAWAYPGMGVNGRGALGVSLAIGGGTWGYPGSQFLINDDISNGWVSNYLDQGSHSNTRWGDFLTARAATTGTSIGDTWLATGFTLHDNSGSAETVPSFYWIGRQRDDPFAPAWVTSYTNSYTEGASADDDTGVFYGPSNCACDYTVSNGWGDGTSSTPSLDNYAPGYFLLFGPHTYAEEGNYTTNLTATDNWGNSASGNGSASVADAPLTAQGTTIYGAKGVALTKTVATFTDADPAGTATDYTATIHWGDGTTSTGTIGGHFTVTGTHAYASTGTRTISVTITDAGGAPATATSTAHIGSLPAISSVSPTSGTHLGGKTVTITGTHLSGAISVKFGTATATITTNSATKITVKTSPHAKGTVDIRVTTKYGTSNITSHDKYKFT